MFKKILFWLNILFVVFMVSMAMRIMLDRTQSQLAKNNVPVESEVLSISDYIYQKRVSTSGGNMSYSSKWVDAIGKKAHCKYTYEGEEYYEILYVDEDEKDLLNVIYSGTVNGYINPDKPDDFYHEIDTNGQYVIGLMMLFSVAFLEFPIFYVIYKNKKRALRSPSKI